MRMFDLTLFAKSPPEKCNDLQKLRLKSVSNRQKVRLKSVMMVQKVRLKSVMVRIHYELRRRC